MSSRALRIVMKLWIVSLFLQICFTIISCKVTVLENAYSVPNNIGSREDWINQAKLQIQNHKPYSVKKYTPYRPSNSVQVPVMRPIISSTSSPLSEIGSINVLNTTSSPIINAIDGVTTESAIPAETSTETTKEIYSTTTETIESSTLLLSMIGKPPGFDTSTTEGNYPKAEIPESTTEQGVWTSTESTSESETSTSTTPLQPESTTEQIVSTTESYESYEDDRVQSTTESDVSPSTSEPPAVTTEKVEEDISTSAYQPDSTTEQVDLNDYNILSNEDRDQSANEAEESVATSESILEVSTTTFQPESTTDFGDSTTEAYYDGLLSNTLLDDSSSDIESSVSTTTIQPESTTESSDTTTKSYYYNDLITENKEGVSDVTSTTYRPESSTELNDITTTEIPTTSADPETTTENVISTTELPLSTTQISRLENETTTELGLSTTDDGVESTTTDIVPTTTETVITTTEILPTTTETVPTVTTLRSAILAEDFIREQPRKFTYSSDVMPEYDYY